MIVSTIPVPKSRVYASFLPYRPGFKKQLMFQDVTAKYCIYDKVPSLPMSFFVRIKGCVNCRTTTSVYKKRVLRAESFSHWELFLKTTASLSKFLLAFIIGLI